MSPGTTAAVQAREANRSLYESADAVESYTADPYHMVRRETAAALLAEALRHDTSGAPALELGSGPASMLDLLPGDGRQHINADLSAAALRHTRNDRIRLDAVSGLPLRDRTLAAVVAGELIEHVFAPDVLLRDLHRVLRPGGALVLTTPNLATLHDRVRFLIGRSPRQVDPLHPYLRLHIRPFTRQSLTRLLAETGFTVSAVRSNFVGWQSPSGRWWQSRWLARVFPGLGGSLVVLAFREERPPGIVPRASGAVGAPVPGPGPLPA